MPPEDGATLERLEETHDQPYVFVSLRTEGIRRTGVLIEAALRRIDDDTRVSRELRVRGSFVGNDDDDRLGFPGDRPPTERGRLGPRRAASQKPA